jgi:hypothetical protein
MKVPRREKEIEADEMLSPREPQGDDANDMG